MTNTTSTFHLGDLLTITTGRLLSPDRMDGVYRIVDFMTGVPHMTHQLPRAAEEIKPYLLEQHPWLKPIQVPEFADQDEVAAWLELAVAAHGERHDVAPMPEGSYTPRDPLAELREMAPGKPIIGVVVPPDAEETAR